MSGDTASRNNVVSTIQRWPAALDADDAVVCSEAFSFDPPIFRAPEHIDDSAQDKVVSVDLSCTLLRTYLSEHKRPDLSTLNFAGPSWLDFCKSHIENAEYGAHFHALGAFNKAGSLLNWDEKLLLMRVRRLVLNGHFLNRLENLDKFQSLTTLRCSQNLLVSASLCLPRLQVLDLSHNHLRYIKLDRLPALRVLHLQHNRFMSPVHEHVNFGVCKRLERLDLSYNLLDWNKDSGDILRMVSQLSGLRSLSLAGNQSSPSQQAYLHLRAHLRNQQMFPALQFLDERDLESDKDFFHTKLETLQKLKAFCKWRLCSMLTPAVKKVVPTGNGKNEKSRVLVYSLTDCLEEQGNPRMIDAETADLGFGCLVKWQRPQKIARKRTDRGSRFYFLSDQQTGDGTRIRENDRFF